MTHSRDVELRQMLEARWSAVEARMATASDDVDFALVQIQAETAQHIAAALERLAAGAYGICRECSEEISENRLRALPFALRCRECQERAEREEERARRDGLRAAATRLSIAADAIGV